MKTQKFERIKQPRTHSSGRQLAARKANGEFYDDPPHPFQARGNNGNYAGLLFAAVPDNEENGDHTDQQNKKEPPPPFAKDTHIRSCLTPRHHADKGKAAGAFPRTLADTIPRRFQRINDIAR